MKAVAQREMTGSLQELLKQTSRSFYLTLRVLPRAVRPQIGLAYLLARTTDTIADTEILPTQERLNALGLLRARIFGHQREPISFGAIAAHQGSPAERTLLERVEDSLALLQTLSAEDLTLVRKVIDTITSGQEMDLLRFGGGAKQTVGTPTPSPSKEGSYVSGASNNTVPLLGGVRGRLPQQIIALQTDAELDDYTYRVAGCVGEFWTKMCRTHLFPGAPLDDAQLLTDGVRFGKGLQLVNILRDLPRDLQQGRCYLPTERLERVGLRPADLVHTKNEAVFRPVYDDLLDRATAHLAAGWNYTNALPAGQWRVRLACAWPILIGVRTVAQLRTGPVLDVGRRIKVSRADVRGILVRSLLRVPFPGLFRNQWRPPAPAGKAVAS
jgi:farnesyl-diphosphate farnesyltransferase